MYTRVEKNSSRFKAGVQTTRNFKDPCLDVRISFTMSLNSIMQPHATKAVSKHKKIINDVNCG
jgi:hypothetical protein